ncbi:hypothetical protein [Sodalis sp.]|uniref:hypothetical protein n=1 Tax=Sodalis sp. (in: enterobacteria) TaxID=1898979 RepID=UPI00387385E2
MIHQFTDISSRTYSVSIGAIEPVGRPDDERGDTNKLSTKRGFFGKTAPYRRCDWRKRDTETALNQRFDFLAMNPQQLNIERQERHNQTEGGTGEKAAYPCHKRSRFN